jgi:hypothetical protein
VAGRLLRRLVVPPSLLANTGSSLSRAELAQAMLMLLFDGLLARVPDGERYAAGVEASRAQIVFDHGALRTVLGPCGALPPGEAAFTRFLRPLGFSCTGLYPLERLRMTGRSWTHDDLPEEMAQFFLSELHPERFTPGFQEVAARVLASSVDPLAPRDLTRIERLGRDRSLPFDEAVALLPRLLACFERHHQLPQVDDYQALQAESAEMAWISTEGNAFNHATDRVPDVAATAQRLREAGYPMKEQVEISRNGRVRQTALRAATVERELRRGAAVERRAVPGSFYEFISRDRFDEGGRSRLDLTFDAGNATAIFKMTEVR